MPKIETLAATVQEFPAPGIKAKDIISAVRERHPGASKKDVVQAAFFALTGGMDEDPEKARRIHDLALAERTADEATAIEPSRTKKPRKKRGPQSDAPRA